MRCQDCGSRLHAGVTDLPFKIGDRSIVVIKDVPVLQCDACPHYLLEDSVMAAVDAILARADEAVELEVVPFAA